MTKTAKRCGGDQRVALLPARPCRNRLTQTKHHDKILPRLLWQRNAHQKVGQGDRRRPCKQNTHHGRGYCPSLLSIDSPLAREKSRANVSWSTGSATWCVADGIWSGPKDTGIHTTEIVVWGSGPLSMECFNDKGFSTLIGLTVLAYPREVGAVSERTILFESVPALQCLWAAPSAFPGMRAIWSAAARRALTTGQVFACQKASPRSCLQNNRLTGSPAGIQTAPSAAWERFPLSRAAEPT